MINFFYHVFISLTYHIRRFKFYLFIISIQSIFRLEIFIECMQIASIYNFRFKKRMKRKIVGYFYLIYLGISFVDTSDLTIDRTQNLCTFISLWSEKQIKTKLKKERPYPDLRSRVHRYPWNTKIHMLYIHSQKLC